MKAKKDMNTDELMRYNLEKGVTIRNIDIPFTNLIRIMVQLGLAVIPASLISGVILGSMYYIFGSLIINLLLSN